MTDALKKQVGGEHYNKHNIQPWHIIDAHKLDFYEGNALKYLLRNKGDRVEDLNKAIHYLERKIELLDELHKGADTQMRKEVGIKTSKQMQEGRDKAITELATRRKPTSTVVSVEELARHAMEAKPKDAVEGQLEYAIDKKTSPHTLKVVEFKDGEWVDHGEKSIYFIGELSDSGEHIYAGSGNWDYTKSPRGRALLRKLEEAKGQTEINFDPVEEYMAKPEDPRGQELTFAEHEAGDQ